MYNVLLKYWVLQNILKDLYIWFWQDNSASLIYHFHLNAVQGLVSSWLWSQHCLVAQWSFLDNFLFLEGEYYSSFCHLKSKLGYLLKSYTKIYPMKNLCSPLTNCGLTLKLTENSFWLHLASSQWTHKMSSHCELAVSFQWVCNSRRELAVSYLWDHPGELTVQW